MILSIICMLFGYSYAWQAQALLKVQNKKQMDIYIHIKSVSDKCDEEAKYLFYPYICEELRTGLKDAGYISFIEFERLKLKFEQNCLENISNHSDLDKLLKLKDHIALNTKCKDVVEDRVKDLLYAEK